MATLLPAMVLALLTASPAQAGPGGWSGSNVPVAVGPGGGLIAVDADTLLVIPGGGRRDWFKYMISGDAWASLPPAGFDINGDGCFTHVHNPFDEDHGVYFLAMIDGSMKFCAYTWKADPAAGGWRSLSEQPYGTQLIGPPVKMAGFWFDAEAPLHVLILEACETSPDPGLGTRYFEYRRVAPGFTESWTPMPRAGDPPNPSDPPLAIVADPGAQVFHVLTAAAEGMAVNSWTYGPRLLTRPDPVWTRGPALTAMPGPEDDPVTIALAMGPAGGLRALASTPTHSVLKQLRQGCAMYRLGVGDTAWTLESASELGATLGDGAGLADPGSGDRLYATAGGGSATLFRYSTKDGENKFINDPQPLPLLPMISTFPCMAAGSGEKLYVAEKPAGAGAQLYSYDPPTATWGWECTLSSNGVSPSAMVAANDGQLFIILGGYLLRWQPPQKRPDLLGPVQGDSFIPLQDGLVSDRQGRLFLAGNAPPNGLADPEGALFAPDSTYSAWSKASSAPGPIDKVASDGSGDLIFATGRGKWFGFYSISKNTWTSPAAPPSMSPKNPVLAMGGDGYDSIFVVVKTSGLQAAFESYSILEDRWTRHGTANVAGESQLIYPGAGKFIYLLRTAAPGGAVVTDFVRCWLPGAHEPGPPDQLSQASLEGTPLAPGGVTGAPGFVARGRVNSPGDGPLRFEVAVAPVGATLDGAATTDAGSFQTSGSIGEVRIPLPAGAAYHWKARTLGAYGLVSPWSEFGDGDVNTADFRIRIDTAPVAIGPGQCSPHTGKLLAEGEWIYGGRIRFQAQGEDADGDGFRWEIEVKPAGEAFEEVATLRVTADESGHLAPAKLDLPIGSYCWRHRMIDAVDGTAGWIDFGASDVDSADFKLVDPGGSLTSRGCQGAARGSARLLTLAVTAILLARSRRGDLTPA